MAVFVVTMTYDLSPATPPDARKLLRAELVGRRWRDRHEDRLMPHNAVWIRRTHPDEHTVRDVFAASERDLADAADAVRRTGRELGVKRSWIHVSGGGLFGLANVAASPETP